MRFMHWTGPDVASYPDPFSVPDAPQPARKGLGKRLAQTYGRDIQQIIDLPNLMSNTVYCSRSQVIDYLWSSNQTDQ